MDALATPRGSLAVAIAALLLVLGLRLARPARPREWLAMATYAAALAAQVLGELGILSGPAYAPGALLRIAGAALLVGGLLLAGKPLRTILRERSRRGTPAEQEATRMALVYPGLSLVLLGQILRGPSRAGAVAVLVAVIVNFWVGRARSHAAR